MYGLLQTLISVISMLLSALVVYIVVFHSPRSMGTYTRFIINFTICDFMMSFCVGFVVRPNPIFPFDGALVEGLVRNIGDTGGAVSFSIILNALAYCLSAQCACILYRFSVLLDNKSIFNFVVSIPTWCCAYCGNVIFTIGTTYLSIQLQIKREELPYFTKQTLRYYPQVPVPDLNNKVFIYMNLTENFYALITGILVVVGFMVVEIISLGCVITIFHQMEVKKNTFSKMTYRMHRQLTAALGAQCAKDKVQDSMAITNFHSFLIQRKLTTAQVVAPIIFIMLPVIYIMIGRYYRWGISELAGQIFILCLDMYGGMSSLITLYFIRPYRSYLFEKFFGWRNWNTVEEWKTEVWVVRTKSISLRGM